MRWLALLFLLSFYSDLSDNRTLFDLFPDLPSLQRKDHIQGSFKESAAFFPAHPTAAVLQADELLFHLPPAVWTDFVACTHASPCTSVKRVQHQAEFSISVAMPLHNLFPQWLYLSIHLYFTDSFEEQKTYIHLVLYEFKFDR